MQRAQPRRISFSQNEWDLECALLAEAGWSTKAIAAETGLTLGQVSIRCHQAGVKRKTYRDGDSKLSKMVRDMLLYRYDPNRMEKIVTKLPTQVEQFRGVYVVHKEKLKREHQAQHHHAAA